MSRMSLLRLNTMVREVQEKLGYVTRKVSTEAKIKQLFNELHE